MLRQLMRITAGSLAATVVVSCSDGAPAAPPAVHVRCPAASYEAPLEVPRCVQLDGVITTAQLSQADSIVQRAASMRDSLRSDTGSASFSKSIDLSRSLARLSEFYSRGLFADSVRFDRLIDHVAVSVEFVRGQVRVVNSRYYPSRTPRLAWSYYAGSGIYFQPVNTVQAIMWIVPDSTSPIDTLRKTAESLYAYSVPLRVGSRTIPRWEYEFTFLAGGIPLSPPWQSAMAQGNAMMMFAELYRRTGERLWRDRAYEAFESYKVPFDRGGVWLSNDTLHGYWFEEYHPDVRVWNGSVQALISLGVFARITGDTLAQRMYARGIEAVKYYTPEYDTGYWTRYSRLQGLNNRFYHGFHVQLMDMLYQQSGDTALKTVADRWRAYTPPTGI